MRRILTTTILLLCFTCFVTYSQFEFYNPEATRNQHLAGDKILSISPNVLINTPNVLQLAGGVKIQLFLGKHFSLDADLMFSRDYYHFGPGILGIPIAMLTFGNNNLTEDEGSTMSEILFYAAAMALSFEHISYHIPLRNHTDISPFISLLRFKDAYEYENFANPHFAGQQLSFATGVQLNKYFGKFVLAPYAEYNIGYKDHLSGINIGVYCGINFLNK